MDPNVEEIQDFIQLHMEMISGMRNGLIAQGFSEEHAAHLTIIWYAKVMTT